MQAMILAAGRGTRLGELGRRLPKALVQVGGRPLLESQLEQLAARGVQRAVINAHHLSEQIVEFVQRGTHPLELEVSVEPELLGTAGGTRAALRRFDAGAPIVVLYADTLIDAPLRELVDGHIASGAQGTICVSWLEHTQGKGIVEVDDRDTIVSFLEKPPSAPPGLANAGVYALDPELIELIPEGRFHDFAIDLFPRALADGRQLRVHRLNGLVHDIGTPDALAKAQGMSNEINPRTLQRSLA